MAYEIKFARVTNSGKLPDRMLTCQHNRPQDLTKGTMGDAFCVVEILSPWFPTAQVGQLVINNFSKYYYQGGSTSDLLNFEESLKHVNESLALATQNGETDWIGKLNSLLAVIVDNNLHIAPTGKIEAYIFRDGKSNHLTEGMTNSVEIHPLKTFSNVISGELKKDDKILLTNSDLFNHLSLESIRQVIALNSPASAASQLTKLLRKTRAKNVNFIIVGLYAKEEISTETNPEEKEAVYYLDKASESFLSEVKNFWQKFLSPISKITSGFILKVGRKSYQATSQKISQLKTRKPPQEVAIDPPSEIDNQTKVSSLPTEELMPKKEEVADPFHREFMSDSSRDDGLLKDEQINFSPDYVHYYREKKQQEKLNEQSIFPSILKKITAWYQMFLAILRDRKKRKYVYIVLALIIIAIIALFATASGKKEKVGNLESQKILDEAIAAQKDAENFLNNGDQAQAKEKFSLAIEKAQSILDNTFVAKDATNVLNTSYQEIDKLTATTRYQNLTALNSSPNKANSFFVISGDIYFIGDDTIYKGSILGGNPQKVISLPQSKGKVISATRADKILYLYTNNQILFSLDTATNQLEQITLAKGKWETANAIANYSGSLYLLDGVLGQVYRHISSRNAFDAGTAYIPVPPQSLKQGLSMAIDGSLYILTSSGQTIKFQRSKLQDFSLKGIPTPYEQMEKPIKIYTDADTPSIYILDNGQKRIVEFDKEGQFVHQYALPEKMETPTDFNVSSKSRKIWVLSKNSVYELNL